MPGETIIVGVSGGPDSMALLHVLLGLGKEWGIAVHVAHVNHGLRKDADKDQKFVQRFAQTKNIPFNTTTLKIARRKGKTSVEDLAREARFNYFFRLARENNIKTIALAHTENDLAETVLMRILRGTGLQGLQAILPKRTFGNFTVIRPFLRINRNEILRYLKSHKVPFRLDPTNRQTKFFRNKVRRSLIPLLEEYNPNIRQALTNLAINAALDYDLLNALGENAFQHAVHYRDGRKIMLKLKELKANHPSLQRAVLRQAVNLLMPGASPTSEQTLAIEQLVEKNALSAVVTLPGNKISLSRDDRYCILLKK